MKKHAAIFALFFVSCYDTSNEYKIDPELVKYANNFYEIASNKYDKTFQKTNLILKLTSGLREQCKCFGLTTLTSHGGQRTIQFDYDFWRSSSESVRETLSLHEFGHGFLGRVQHSEGNSLMNPKISATGWPTNFYRIDFDHNILLDELFKK